MAWNEPWTREDRSKPSEIPSEYNGLRPSGRGKLTAGYFLGVFVLFYVALKLFGGKAMLIAGYPILMWMAGGLIVLVLIGLYVFAWQSETALTSDIESETDAQAEDLSDR
jgi:uncharacterized membrane protein